MFQFVARKEGRSGKHARLIALSMLVLPSLSHALSVEISDGTNTYSCSDGDACDLGPGSGLMTFSQQVGTLGSSWLATVTTAFSKPAAGSALAPSLSLTSVDLSGSSPAPLTIKLSETGFTTPDALNAFDFSAGATLNGMTATVTAYADNTNALYGTGTLLGSSPIWQDPNSNDNAAAAFSFNSQFAANTAQPFSLTLIATLSNPSGLRSATVSGALNYAPVPIPAAVWLFGSALAGMGIIGRRKAATA